MNLTERLHALCVDFANQIVAAVTSASMSEIIGVLGPSPVAAPRELAKAPTKRLARRSGGDIQKTLERVLKALADHPEGMRSEQIQKVLGLDKRELVKPLRVGLEGKSLVKTGDKRSTTYKLPKAKKTPDLKVVPEPVVEEPKVEHEIRADQMALDLETEKPKGVKRKHPFVKKRKKAA